jgi:DNA-binding transcriptional regulator YhcF (GntR family)
MAIDWANEPYVRLYKRETDDDLLLTWEARAVWHEMLKRFDRSGLLETRRGVRGLAAMIRIPLDVVERVLQELLEDGRVVSIPNVGFAAKNYISANDTPRTDRARKEESRHRRINSVLSSTNSEIQCHAESRAVTQSRADQIISDHQSPEIPAPGDGLSLNAPLELTTEPAPKKRGRKPSASTSIPEDWEPRQQERELARSLGIDCEHAANEFRAYWLGDGRTKKNWDMTFQNRLYTLSNGRRWPQQPQQEVQSRGPRKIKDL